MKKILLTFLFVVSVSFYSFADTYGWGHGVTIKSINTYSDNMLIEFTGGQIDANCGVAYFNGTTLQGKVWAALLISAMNNGNELDVLVQTSGTTYPDHFSRTYFPLVGIYVKK
jgi:hypothetical protein